MNISLCGYGWLGQPLAKKLLVCGHQVVATKRSVAKTSTLNQFGVEIIPMTLGEALSPEAKKKLFASHILIINIPPGRKSFNPTAFIHDMCSLIDNAKFNGVSQVIFISTSAVYGDSEGIITESSLPSPATASGQAHLAIEQHLQQQYAQQATILRLAGLVGGDRHPVKHLSGRREILNGQQCVNLIHQLDVINAISHIIDKQIYGDVLHLACPDHPSRQDYYTWASERLGLAAPQFAKPGTLKGKRIDATYSLKKLELALVYPSPYAFLGVSH